MTDVAVIIPTLRRPDSLARALRSVFAQTGVGAENLSEIIVVDNDPAGSARVVVAEMTAASPHTLVYVEAPRPGVATARNAGLAATTAPLIAFLDDDEVASATWLSALIAASEETGADAVFGPIQGRADGAAAWLRPYLDRFFGREGPTRTQRIDRPYGCGNSLLIRATALPGDAPFDPASDQIGGEDDVLFASLASRGGVFGWAADAWVDEIAPPHRATLNYALIRAFAYGQGPSQNAAAAGDWAGVAKWMAVGAAQVALHASHSIALFTLRHRDRPFAYDRTARGLGKIFWGERFEPRFYGAEEVARLDRSP